MEDADFTTVLAQNKEKSNTSLEVFKQPVIVGKRPGAKSKNNAPEKRIVSTENGKNSEALVSNTEVATTSGDDCVNNNPSVPPNKVQDKILTPSLPKYAETDYKPPSWSGMCEKDFYLEILKNGCIVEMTDLTTKPYFMFGRLPGNNIVLEHPSISRYHAVLQYREVAGEGMDAGWYLYDLGSTHGTTLNKQPLPARIYTRIRAGHMFKLGASSRLYILQGPEEDQEKESELTVTEIKELRNKREALMEQHDNPEPDKVALSSEECPKNSSQGIDWGMGEDAEEENPNAENPFAIIDEPGCNEDLYVEDPKKALKNWFEREGYDLDYQVEERSYAFFICRVELPIDNANGTPVIAEASVRGGKKREAIVQCALEACRILDQHGLFRQSNRESKAKRKRERDEDYYSSDEDSFLDRTGAAERKRLARMGKTGGDTETYESLIAKCEIVKKQIEEIERNMEAVGKQSSKATTQDDEDLDAYINSLKAQESAPKKSAAALRVKLAQLQKEEKRLNSLIQVAKPLTLPALPPMPVMAYSEEPIEEPAKSEPLSSQNVKPSEPIPHESPKTKDENQESGLQKTSVSPAKVTREEGKKKESFQADVQSKLEIEKKKTSKAEPLNANTTKEKESLKSKPSTESVYVLEGQNEQESGGLILRKKKSKATNSSKKIDMPKWVQYEAEDSSKYDMWIPPSDQTGDGKTALNKKLGY